MTEPGWQPIETAPKDVRVLLWSPVSNLFSPPIPKDAEPDIRVSSTRHWTWATHWMPLPEPPEAGHD
jgi:hypothetical protein